MQQPKARGIDGGYVDLDVYQRSMRLMKRVHALVRSFPDYEKYDPADQMRRASKSIAANIAEGYARRAAPKEFARSLRIALGSANEMESHIRTALQLDRGRRGRPPTYRGIRDRRKAAPQTHPVLE